MTKVFVHGNPETADVWHRLVSELADLGIGDVALLSPPGFGAACPPEWIATPAAYVGWLREEISALDGPIDLLGHDWGAGHVLGLAAEHPEAIRSWAVDCGGLVHSRYEWHDAAMAWQTEGLGEEAIDLMLALSPAERTAAYEGLGLDAGVATALADAFDADMGRCILELYRAAAQPFMAQLGNRLAAADSNPSLLINATADPYVDSSLTGDVAQRLGSLVHTLDQQGHWWMLSAPQQAAEGLADFWRGLDGSATQRN